MKENKRKCFKCGVSPGDDPHIKLHRFPKPGRTNPLKCELWAKFCFPNGLWHSTDFQMKLYTEHRMLCQKHFKKTSFVDDAYTKLFKSATPIIDDNDQLSNNPMEWTNYTGEPLAGTSRMTQPLLENINIINQTTMNLGTESPQKEDSIMQEASKVHNENTQEKHDILLKKCKKNLRKISRLKVALNKLKNKSFLEEISDNKSVNSLLKQKMSPEFALLLQGQIKNFNIKSKARRWDTDSKIVALRIYKRSPRCYRLLRRIMCLPAPTTLKGMLSKFNLNVGINKKIFQVLKKKAGNSLMENNEYILMFDEMSIKKNLNYNEKDDKIDGYQDHGDQGRSPQIASHALVFMIAGVRKPVKQPIAYYISGGSVTADRLAVLIKKVVHHCFEAGIRICATVCDMDGVNKRALGLLGASVDHPSINIEDREVVTLFDAPHLLKCFRNLFLKYDVECPTSIADGKGIGIAKWSHIKDFYELDYNNPNFVFAPCLKQEHLNPNCKQKMRVKLAAQVLSHSVAAGMFAKIAEGELTTAATVTALMLSKMDELFDSVNSYTPDRRRGKPFATNIQKDSPHLKLFKEMKHFFKNMKFLGCQRTPPSQEGWVWTLNGLERIWHILSNKYKNIKSLATRRFQQDPLENLFGCIRGNCGSNVNPTVGQFVAGLKTAILSNLSHMSVGNCENDENEAIICDYKILLKPTTGISTTSDLKENKSNEININYELEDVITQNSGETQACAYVCGFIIRNNPNIDCVICKEILISNEKLPEHLFVEFKQYQNCKNTLLYASNDMILCVEKMATQINNYLKNEAYKEGVKKNVQELLKKSVNFNIFEKCTLHKVENITYVINSTFYICIKRYCILKNRQFVEEAKYSLRKKIDILKHI